jgi:hypothetical protein
MATGDLKGDEACEDICVAIDAYFADRGDDKTPSGGLDLLRKEEKLARAEAALREIRLEIPSERYGRNHADMGGLIDQLKRIDNIARAYFAGAF